LGYYQFPPAGGFELFENEQVFSMETIKSHYSLKLALYREYLEEVFDCKEFQDPPIGNVEPIQMIERHKEIEKLEKMYEKGDAKLELLGVTIDLVSMRHSVSFALVINDVEYSKEMFSMNDEFKNVRGRLRIPIDVIDGIIKNNEFVQDSALLYDMFKSRHPELFQKKNNLVFKMGFFCRSVLWRELLINNV
jgi:hypothetical protein